VKKLDRAVRGAVEIRCTVIPELNPTFETWPYLAQARALEAAEVAAFMSANDELVRVSRESLLDFGRAIQELQERAAEQLFSFRFPPDVEDLITLGHSDRTENQREAAAARLLDRWAPLPVHHKRWTRVSSELRHLAEMHGRSPEVELRMLAIGRLIEIVDATANYTLDEIPGIVRRSLNRLITEDILGFDWRRTHENNDVLKSASMFAHVDAEIMVTAFIQRARLREREIEILFRMSQGEASADIGAALGLKADTVRQIYHRSLKKLRAVASAA
jgi:DNA-binding CsgD family transcriptional regulator